MTATLTLLSFLVIAAMVCTCTGTPLLQSAHEAREVPESRKIRGLQVQRGAQGPRMERFAPLPEDQRRFTSKQILQALSGKCPWMELIFGHYPPSFMSHLVLFDVLTEIIQRDDCISDYQGWVDFGRRSTD